MGVRDVVSHLRPRFVEIIRARAAPAASKTMQPKSYPVEALFQVPVRLGGANGWDTYDGIIVEGAWKDAQLFNKKSIRFFIKQFSIVIRNCKYFCSYYLIVLK